MDVFEAVKTVLAVRSYENKPVPAESINKIIEAGRLTGSSMNRQPWAFVVVENPETIKKLSTLAQTGPYISQAAAAIVVAVENTVFAESDASRAIQSMILTAWSEGLGTNWVGFKGLSDVKAALDIPENLEVFAIVPIGYPTKKIGKGKKNRKPLSEIAYRDKFGQPYN